MKAMILFSGGLDSTTALAMAVREYGAENCVALSIYYGQRHEKEIKCAKAIAKHYGIERYTLDVSKIFKNSECALLKGRKEQIQNGSYDEQIRIAEGEAVTTYVPYRNGLFLSVAASMAISLRCDEIYYGAHRDDKKCEELTGKTIKENLEGVYIWVKLISFACKVGSSTTTDLGSITHIWRSVPINSYVCTMITRNACSHLTP